MGQAADMFVDGRADVEAGITYGADGEYCGAKVVAFLTDAGHGARRRRWRRSRRMREWTLAAISGGYRDSQNVPWR